MRSHNLSLEKRLDKMEEEMGEILFLLRQLVPVISKKDYIEKCGNNGILLIDKWNEKIKKSQNAIETEKRF